MKRFVDLVLTVLMLVILSIPILFLIFLVRLKLGSPVFFHQLRPGLHGRPFKMVKFRTMTNERNSDGYLLADSERLTPFGRFFRASSMDELPELWNVLKGEMSLVGPRPLLMEYLLLYSSDQARRHEVRPGVTGWAQINGRNKLGWDEKFLLDIWYVDHHTTKLDIKILLLTIRKVLTREGVSAQGDTTMPNFVGSKK